MRLVESRGVSLLEAREHHRLVQLSCFVFCFSETEGLSYREGGGHVRER